MISPAISRSRILSGESRVLEVTLFLLSAFGLCVLTLMLSLGMSDQAIFGDYFRHPLIVLLNLLPIFLFQCLLLCVFNRQWPAFLVTALVFLGSAIGNFYKLKFRNEPFLFSDLSLIGTALGVSGKYDLTPNFRIIFSLAAVLVGTVTLFFLCRDRLSVRFRLVLGAAVLVSLFPLWFFVYSSEDVYENKAVANEHVLDNRIQEKAISKGFVYNFIYSIKDRPDVAPEGYSEERAKEILSRYSFDAIPEDKKVNLLVFQLESFCDLANYGMEDISEDVYAGYRSIRDEAYSGTLICNSIGGGTVNSERCFLTGNVTLPEFKRDSYSFVRYLLSQDYAAFGSHPYSFTFYDRANNNRYLGFEEYRFREDHYGELFSSYPDEWRNDAGLFPDILDWFNEHIESGRRCFSFNVTLQGHGQYPSESCPSGHIHFKRAGIDEAALNQVNNYLDMVSETSDILLNTVEYLRGYKEPVVLLLYGDHMPLLPFEVTSTVYDRDSIEGNLAYFSTEYVIWANDAAKALYGKDFSGKGPTISPAFLMSVLFDELEWKGDRLIKLNRELREHVSVVHSNGFCIEDGVPCSALSEDALALLNDYNTVQYYMRSTYLSDFQSEYLEKDK